MQINKISKPLLIRSKQSSKTIEATLSVLGERDITALLDLERVTMSCLEDQRLYFPGNPQVFEDSLSGRGIVVGCHAGEILVGFRSVWFPGGHHSNLGLDVGLRDTGQLEAVAHLERSCVHPEFRGNRLQIQMTEMAIKLALNENYKYMLSTVAPQNYASMADKFAVGMFICKILKKYDGLDRYVFFKNMKRNILNGNIVQDSYRSISGDDINGQYEALKASDVIGIRLAKSVDRTDIAFCSINCEITDG